MSLATSSSFSPTIKTEASVTMEFLPARSTMARQRRELPEAARRKLILNSRVSTSPAPETLRAGATCRVVRQGCDHAPMHEPMLLPKSLLNFEPRFTPSFAYTNQADIEFTHEIGAVEDFLN